MITAKHLYLSFGSQPIFDDLNLHLDSNQRVGLVGPNGAGKSTFLKTLAGLQKLDKGTIIMAGGKRLAYMPQEVVLNSTKNVFDEAFSTFKDLYDLQSEALSIEAQIEKGLAPEMVERYAEIQEKLTHFNPIEIHRKVSQVLTGLGFSQEQQQKPVDALSVGWKMRLVLAKLLLQDADFYLFDEPTNHLDIVAKDWFLRFLQNASFGFLFVSHERHFLDHVCDFILALERGKATLYKGNYAAYEQQKEADRERLELAVTLQQRELARKKEIADKFRAKASKAKMAQKLLREIEATEIITPPPTPKTGRFTFTTTERAGRIVLEVKNLAFSFGTQQIFHNVTFTVERNQKVAIIAPNGTGKSTLLNVIMGKLPIQKGTVELGYNVFPAFFAQDQNKALDLEATVFQNVAASSPGTSEQTIRTFLGSFLFSNEDVKKKVKVLSGGEKNKVSMVIVLLQKANFLLLDEPTNHLDIQAKDVLLKALQDYTGTLLFVSHDHTFINNLATHILELTADGTALYHGNYESYLEHKKDVDHMSAPAPSKQEKDQEVEDSSKKDSYELRKEIGKLEKKIEKIEKEIKEIEYSFGDLEYGTTEFAQAQARLTVLKKELKPVIESWEKMQTQASDNL